MWNCISYTLNINKIHLALILICPVYSTKRVDHSNTRLATQLDRNPGMPQCSLLSMLIDFCSEMKVTLCFLSWRCRWQQFELDFLRAPDPLSAAQPLWRLTARPLGELQHGWLLHPRVRLPQRSGAHHRNRQRPCDLPAEGSRVQRSAAWDV